MKQMAMLEKSVWQGTEGGLGPTDLKKLNVANNHVREPGSYNSPVEPSDETSILANTVSVASRETMT